MAGPSLRGGRDAAVGCQNREVVRRPAAEADPRTVSWSDPSATVGAMGEEALLSALVSLAGGPDPAVCVAAGDDAAGWTPPAGHTVVVTTDAIVEDVDFRRRYQLPYAVGWKVYAVSCSDLAAMGASPALVVVTLLLPETTASGAVLALQRGIADAARLDGARVVGGDVSRTAGGVAVSCTAIGTAPAGHLLLRSAGRPGDRLLVTGEVGGAAAALERLEAGDPVERVAWAERLLSPRARVAAGRQLARAGVRCAIDCSDGVLLDTERLAQASGCGAELWADRLPLAGGLAAVWGRERLVRALTGGEDFELIAAAPAALADPLADGVGWPGDLPPLRVVGQLRPEPGLTLRRRRGGPAIPLGPHRGFAHF